MARRRNNQSRGEKVGPGLYAKDGVLHLYTEEVLAALNLPDTPHNRELVAQVAERLAAEWRCPEATRFGLDSPEGTREVTREQWLTPEPEVN